MLLWRRCFVAGVVMLASCGGSEPYTLVIEDHQDQIAYLAIQDGDGPWEQYGPDSRMGLVDVTKVEVTRGYHALVWACVGRAGDPMVVSARFETETGTPQFRFAPCAVQRPLVRLVGDVTPPDAQIWLNGGGLLAHPPGRFDAMVPDDTGVLIAVADDRMLIRPYVPDAPLDTLVSLDVADGFDLERLTLPIVATGPVTPYSEVIVDVGHGWVRRDGVGTEVTVVPEADFALDLWQVVGARQGPAEDWRLVERNYSGGPVTEQMRFSMVAAPEADRASGRWDANWTSAEFTLRRGDGFQLRETIDATWSAATGATTLPWIDVADLPGWSPSAPRFQSGDALEWTSTGWHRSLARHAAGRQGTLTW